MLRLLILFVLLFLFDSYAFQAYATVAASWSDLAKNILTVAYWSVPVLAVGMMIAYVITMLPRKYKAQFDTLRGILMIAYFSKFLTISVLALGDIWRLLLTSFVGLTGWEHIDLSRPDFILYLAVFLGILSFVMLTYGILRNPFRYKVYRETVPLDTLPKKLEGLKIVQISDIHSGSFRAKEPIRKAIELINKEQADLVFFTGDLVNSIAKEMDNYIDVFDQIKAKYGVYSIVGNHDYGDYVRWSSQEAKQQNFESLKNTHRKMGWDLMLNEHRMLDINGEKVAVIGVENYSADRRFHKYGNLSLAAKGTDEAAIKLLLSHDPTHWEDQVIQDFKDIAITFSGHTHGAQFGLEIPGWVKWSPIKYFYKNWAGLYQNEKQYLYVNRGFGVLGYPGRVGILPEITVINLVQK